MSSSRQPPTGVHLPSLAAELPDGWSVSEGATFVAPSGARLNVRYQRVESGATATALARRAAVDGTDVGVVEEPAVALLRGDAAVCRAGAMDGPGRRALCLVDDGRALVVTAAWSATESGAQVTADMDHLARSLRLLDRPVLRIGAVVPDVARSDDPPSQRVPVADGAWDAVRVGWARTRPSAAVHAAAGRRWSVDELAVIATVLGAPSFPTVGGDALASLTTPELDALVGAVTRSLVARELLHAGAGGAAVLDHSVQEQMDLAVRADLTVLVERRGLGIGSQRWFGVRPERGLSVTVNADGSRTCTDLDPADLLVEVLSEAGVPPADESTIDAQDPAAEPMVVPFDEVGSADGLVHAVTTVTTAWRTVSGVEGGVLTWAVGRDGRSWSGTIDAARRALVLHRADRTASAIELLAHLPGA